MLRSRRTWELGAAVALSLAIASVAAVLSSAAGTRVTLVSKSSTGEPADGNSRLRANGGSISRDGRLAVFSSDSANLPQGDGTTDRCYVRNLRTGKTRLVSVTSDGTPATGQAQNPSISANGRFVGFSGNGEGLPGADPVYDQSWVHDLKTRKTRLISRAPSGDPASGGTSEYPSFSADGRFAAFQSSATNLPGSDGSSEIVYVRDLERNRTLVGSRTAGGDAAYASIYGQALSSDGRRLAFFSTDSDLPRGDGAVEHVYVRDLKTGRVKLADQTNGGQTGNSDAADAAMSGDGRYVAFASDATNLPGGAGPSTQVYLRDLRRGRTILVGRNSAGVTQDGDAEFPHPSGDGRYVAFRATGANLPGGDGSTQQIYVRDLRAGKTRLASHNAEGDPADANADGPSMSLDGSWVLFETGAENLGGTSGVTDVFRVGPIR